MTESTPPWLPPEPDGTPAKRGPGGWHEHNGMAVQYLHDSRVEVLLREQQNERSSKTRDWKIGDHNSNLFVEPALHFSPRGVVAYRLACPEARRLEAENARLREAIALERAV